MTFMTDFLAGYGVSFAVASSPSIIPNVAFN